MMQPCKCMGHEGPFNIPRAIRHFCLKACPYLHGPRTRKCHPYCGWNPNTVCWGCVYATVLDWPRRKSVTLPGLLGPHLRFVNKIKVSQEVQPMPGTLGSSCLVSESLLAGFHDLPYFLLSWVMLHCIHLFRLSWLETVTTIWIHLSPPNSCWCVVFCTMLWRDGRTLGGVHHEGDLALCMS